MSEVYSRIIMAYVQPREGCPRLCSRSMQQMAILVRKFYEERSRDFCKSHGIHDVQSLQNRLKEGAKFYPALNGRAEEVLARTQNSSRMATVIVESGALLN